MKSLGIYLYLKGFIITKTTRAASITGSKGWTTATFSLCSGNIITVIPLNKNTAYNFYLSQEILEGEIEVQIYNGKTKILSLNRECETGHFTTSKRKYHFLVIHFNKATGNYKLQFNIV